MTMAKTLAKTLAKTMAQNSSGRRQRRRGNGADTTRTTARTRPLPLTTNGAEEKVSDAEKKKAEEEAKGKPNNGLDVLGRDCKNSGLERHDGFQKAPRCVETAFGEVSSADKNPSLLITESPNRVKAGQKFTITVSTRNLVRDRFLGAAAGGYYLESSFLNEEGLQRGALPHRMPDAGEQRRRARPGAGPAGVRGHPGRWRQAPSRTR